MLNKPSKNGFLFPNKNVRPGWLLHIRGQATYKIMEPDPNIKSKLVLPVEDIKTHEKKLITIAELDQLSHAGERYLFAATSEELAKLLQTDNNPAEESSAPSNSISPALLEQADQIIATINWIDASLNETERKCRAVGLPFNKNLRLEQVCLELKSTNIKLKIGRANYYTYKRRIINADGDRVRFAASLRRSSYQKTTKSPAEVLFIDSVILCHAQNREVQRGRLPLYKLAKEYYEHAQGWWVDPRKCTDIPADLVSELMNPLIPLEIILNNPEKACYITKIALPSQAWFYSHLKWFVSNPDQGEKTMIQRYGKEFYEKNILSFDTFVTRASLPLEYVFADHCLIDIFIVDDETRSQIFRVWVTVLIDVFSRAILGMALLHEDPCIESIQTALGNAIWDKTEFLADMDLKYPEGQGWECYGIPLRLSLDNAWGHHSISLENVCKNISLNGQFNEIELCFRPPYKGRYGALIERFFGNLQAKIKARLLPGAILENKPDSIRNAAKEARLLFSDLKKILVEMIVEYMHTPHSELNQMTPHEKLMEGLQSSWPLVPNRTKAIERIFWRSDPETKTISKNGVSAFGLHYRADELDICQKIGTDGKRIRYGFSYQPNDISRIALFRDGKFICDLYAKELRLPDSTYQHVGLPEKKLAQQIAKSCGEKASEWLKHINEIDEVSKQRNHEKKTAHNSAKRKSSSPTSPQFSRDDRTQLQRLQGFYGDEIN